MQTAIKLKCKTVLYEGSDKVLKATEKRSVDFYCIDSVNERYFKIFG